jgi:hypothetical protein
MQLNKKQILPNFKISCRFEKIEKIYQQLIKEINVINN